MVEKLTHLIILLKDVTLWGFFGCLSGDLRDPNFGILFLSRRTLPFPFKKKLSLKRTETLRLSLKNLPLMKKSVLRFAKFRDH